MRDSEVFKSGGVILEGFELVLQSRYLTQIFPRGVLCVCARVHACMFCHDHLFQCVKWNIREEIGGLTQLSGHWQFISEKKNLRNKSKMANNCKLHIVGNYDMLEEFSEEMRKNNWASLHRRNKVFLCIYRGIKMGKGRVWGRGYRGMAISRVGLKTSFLDRTQLSSEMILQ